MQVLYDAVSKGSEYVVQLLLEFGVEPALQDCDGQTPLSLAVILGQWGCADALLRSSGGAVAVQVTDILSCVHFYLCLTLPLCVPCMPPPVVT